MRRQPHSWHSATCTKHHTTQAALDSTDLALLSRLSAAIPRPVGWPKQVMQVLLCWRTAPLHDAATQRLQVQPGTAAGTAWYDPQSPLRDPQS
jgi:hypothetical protein